MLLLWMNLLLVFVCAFFARYAARPVLAGAVPVSVQPNKLLTLCALISLVFISGMRTGIGDTFVYRKNFEMTHFSWASILDEKDIGFGVLQMVLKNFVSTDSQVLIFTSALITNVLILIVLYNYSRMLEIALYVYITGGLFLVSMNGMRQVLAAAIAFTAIKYLTEGKLFKYAIVIVFASLFHQSALVLLPIYFLVRSKAWSKATVALIILSIMIVIGFEKFSALLFTVIEDTQYGAYKDFDEGGANLLRVAVTAVPLVIAYLGREKLKRILPASDSIVNMALLGLVFMLISTKSWIFARVSIYFELYELILISWVVKLFREKDQKVIYFAIIVCYLIYFYYEHVISLNIYYKSVFQFW